MHKGEFMSTIECISVGEFLRKPCGMSVTTDACVLYWKGSLLEHPKSTSWRKKPMDSANPEQLEELFKKLGSVPSTDEEYLVIGGEPTALLFKDSQKLGEDDCTYVGERRVFGSNRVEYRAFKHHKGVTVGKWAYAIHSGIDVDDKAAMEAAFTGFDVKHSCGTKNCVNPGHVYLRPQSSARKAWLEIMHE